MKHDNAVFLLRDRLKVTQEEFAHLLGLTTGTINRWERGQAPQGHNQACLDLLRATLVNNTPDIVLQLLRNAGGKPIDIVRALARLEGRNAHDN